MSSKDLGRKLQEDLSISPLGVRDFGAESGMSPVDVVMQYGNKDLGAAADWLRERLGGSGNKEKTEKKEPDIHWHGEHVALVERWLIKGCLPETGVALLSGQWGVYKTFTALDLCGSVMMGEDFAGRKCKRQGGVMFVAAEVPTQFPSD